MNRTIEDDERFKTARKLKYMDYEGSVLYWAGAGPSGRFFRNKTEIETYCNVHKLSSPRWVWGCKHVSSIFNAKRVIGTLGSPESLEAVLTPEAVQALQMVLDGWAESLELVALVADFDTAVVLDRALYSKTEKIHYEIDGYEPLCEDELASDGEPQLELM